MCALDPVRLLLTLGANPAMVDYTHGNTALHWAILARNATAISTLVLKSKASLDVPNLRAETPLTMLEAQSGAIWIGAKVMDRVKEAALTSQQRRSLVSKLRHDKRLRWWSMVACPFTAFYLAGIVFTINTLYIIKFFLLGCLYAIFHTIGKALFDEHLMALLPLSVYLATKAWFYVTWLMYIDDAVSLATTVCFLICSLGLWVCFLKSWKGDPGIIRPTREQRFKVKGKFLLLNITILLSFYIFCFRQLLSYRSAVALDLSPPPSARDAWYDAQYVPSTALSATVVWHGSTIIAPG